MIKKLPNHLSIKSTGLRNVEVLANRDKFGRNILPTPKKPSVMYLLFHQFANPLMFILLVAFGLSLILEEFTQAFVIVLAMSLQVLLGFVEEFRAHRSFEELEQFIESETRVWRDNSLVKLPSKDLVVGDLIEIGTGERIPADIVFVEAYDLTCDEAVLTGESDWVSKKAYIEKQDNKSMFGFSGTTIMTGRGKGIVVAVGSLTTFGEIAENLKTLKDEPTPLQIRIRLLSRQLLLMVLLFVVAVLILGLYRNYPLNLMIQTTVSLAVAAVPEGLVVALTALLAISMRRLLKKKALVRTLLAAETLGTVTLILTDKTGTLTTGLMKVVGHTGFFDGEVFSLLAKASSTGNPTDTSILSYAQAKLGNLDEYSLIAEVPFSSSEKKSEHYYSYKNKVIGLLKGSPELILSLCGLTLAEKTHLEAKIAEASIDGGRILAVARWDHTGKYSKKIPKRWNWVGFINLQDPLRESVPNALKECQTAGIRVIVVTGDRAETAKSVLRLAGINVTTEEFVSGDELKGYSDSELELTLKNIKLIYRVDPEQKLRLVELFQKNGEVVAMIGDGVNDALALKKADIGVVLGTGTEVSKEVADIVLLNNDFAGIVTAIREGRGVFSNLQKIVLYLLSDGFSEIFLIFGSLILKVPLPLTPLMILYINLVTDGLPQLALSVDRPNDQIMKVKPISTHLGIITKEMVYLILVITSFTTFGCMAIVLGLGGFPEEVRDTLVFVTLSIDSLLYVFVIRSFTEKKFSFSLTSNRFLFWSVIFGLGMVLFAIYNPFLSEAMGLVQIGMRPWFYVIGLVSLTIFGILTARISLRLHDGLSPLR